MSLYTTGSLVDAHLQTVCTELLLCHSEFLFRQHLLTLPTRWTAAHPWRSALLVTHIPLGQMAFHFGFDLSTACECTILSVKESSENSWQTLFLMHCARLSDSWRFIISFQPHWSACVLACVLSAKFSGYAHAG